MTTYSVKLKDANGNKFHPYTQFILDGRSNYIINYGSSTCSITPSSISTITYYIGSTFEGNCNTPFYYAYTSASLTFPNLNTENIVTAIINIAGSNMNFYLSIQHSAYAIGVGFRGPNLDHTIYSVIVYCMLHRTANSKAVNLPFQYLFIDSSL